MPETENDQTPVEQGPAEKFLAAIHARVSKRHHLDPPRTHLFRVSRQDFEMLNKGLVSAGQHLVLRDEKDVPFASLIQDDKLKPGDVQDA